MKPSDPLAKLLKAAAQAERLRPAEAPQLPFGVQARVLSACRTASEPFSLVPLIQRALACAAAIALISSGALFLQRDRTNLYDYTINYSLAAAYLE